VELVLHDEQVAKGWGALITRGHHSGVSSKRIVRRR
jgi:hypothetical protein